MRSTNHRLEEATRARNQRLSLEWLEQNPPSRCPICDKPLPTAVPGSKQRGRRRVWCSDACRQKAYRARRATTATSTAPLPDVTPQPPAEPSAHPIDDCIVAVLNAPSAIVAVLDVVRRASRDGALDRPDFEVIQLALVALMEQLNAPPP